ncbi:TolC family protein [Dyella sp. ASV21]|uniref:TolC family protein n=1 Tax=Dyella sp. ASV21 TaxID=2795114 RepID=UPI0018ED672E|nr:TolC family protein [Dyella sp. ASV21]
MKRLWCLLSLACAPAWAVEAADPMLPPAELVLRAVSEVPEVRGAEAGLARADAQARMRASGSYETQLTLIPQQRRVPGDRNYNEWEMDLTRSVRLPSKVRLDREIGASGQQAAQLGLEDAHHAAARHLLAYWSDWQRARVERQQWEQLVAIAQRDRDAVARRVELGDAAVRDRLAVEALLAQAQAALARAQSAQTQAELAWNSSFTRLPLPQREPLADYTPPALEGSDEGWVGQIVARSHEIGATAALARQKDAQARRARADRLPDPTVGIRVLNDRNGRERAYGLVVGIPLGGSYRRAEAASTAADAQLAEAELSLVQRDIERQARSEVAAARAQREIWQRQREARDAAREHAGKAARAYALGESGMAELLAARRIEQEAVLAERQAAIDALEAVARVQVDAHARWHRHDDADDAAAGDTPSAAGIRLPALGNQAGR